jgi:hypothetical protein
MRSYPRKAKAALALAVALIAIPTASASAFTTVLNSGATGSWLGSTVLWNVCYSSLHRVDTENPSVGRTSRYPSSSQTIYMQPRLEITSDGRTWSRYRYGGFSSATTSPGQQVNFGSTTFSGLPSGYGYRVAMHFWWYVGSTAVGEVDDLFNQSGDYYAPSGGVFNGGCSI